MAQHQRARTAERVQHAVSALMLAAAILCTAIGAPMAEETAAAAATPSPASSPASSPVSSPEARPDRFTYAVYVGGLRAVEAALSFSPEPGQYSIVLDSAPVGMLGWFDTWRSILVAEGRRTRTGRFDVPIAPGTAVVQRIEPDKERLATYQYATDPTVPVVEAYRPPRSSDKKSLEAEYRTGVLAPLAGIAGLILHVTDGGACDVTLPMYDGKRRFEAILADLGTTALEETRYGIYSGPVRHCRLTLSAVAGDFGRFDDPREVPEAAGPLPFALDVWMASPGPGLASVPVRIDAPFPFANAVIHLTGAERNRGTLVAELPEPQIDPDDTYGADDAVVDR